MTNILEAKKREESCTMPVDLRSNNRISCYSQVRLLKLMQNILLASCIVIPNIDKHC